LLQARIFLDQDRSADGARAAFKALELAPQKISEVLALSDDFYLGEAKAVYAKVVALGSQEVLPYLGLGNISLHSGDLKEAEKWFEKARAMQPGHPAVLLAWGRLTAAKAQQLKDQAQAKRLYQEARDMLERSRAKGEDSSTIYAEMGSVYFKLGVWEKAVDSYQEAVRMKRRRDDWRLSLGQAYAKLGKISEAERKYREVLAFNPDDAEAWRALQELGKKY
jgi:tetratricopeptide (TPR) repeat protein